MTAAEFAAECAEHLETIRPDLQSLTRLFGLPDSLWETEAFRFTAGTDPEGRHFECRFTAAGSGRQAARQVPVPAETGDPRLDLLHRRRALRRLCRQCCYDLLRAETGLHPAWGSLTGIRPTRLIWEQLEQGIPLAEAEKNLTEQFDVQPEKARLLGEIVAEQQRLPAPGDGWMDVYIGIPFCVTRCSYCSFSSGELGDGRLVPPYLAALTREMAAGAELIRRSGRRLRTLYVGGGTPTSLNEAQLAEFLAQVMRLYPGAQEYTVEAGRPDTITPGKLAAIRDAGVGRISINPQTMNNRTLERIGRAHTAEQTVAAYAMAREAGIRSINMDVIAALPGETEADFARTLAAARALRPESLTVHTLAVKRSSRLHLEGTPLTDGETAAAMTAMGREAARAMGMAPYYLYRRKYMAGSQENVGYALPGHACLYNVDIMEEHTHILALGAGGISKRVYPEEGHIGRAPNVSNIEQYIDRVEEMIRRKEELFLEEPGTLERQEG